MTHLIGIIRSHGHKASVAGSDLRVASLDHTGAWNVEIIPATYADVRIWLGY